MSSVEQSTLKEEQQQQKRKKRDHRWLFCELPLPKTATLNKIALNTLVITIITDLCASLALFSFTDGYHTFHLRSFSEFSQSTADLQCLFITRMLTLITLSLICINYGVPIDLWQKKKQKNKEMVIKRSKSNSKYNNNPKLDRIPSVKNIIFGARSSVPMFKDQSEEQEYDERKQDALMYKYISLISLFICFTGFQAYTGIKCVLFNFPSNRLTQSAMLFGCIVLCINIEVLSLWIFLNDATDFGEGIFIPELHQHILHKQDKVRHWCEMCRSRAKQYTYHCDQCTWDCCQTCYKKFVQRTLNNNNHQKSAQKNQDSNMDEQIHQNNLRLTVDSKDGGPLKVDSSSIFGSTKKKNNNNIHQIDEDESKKLSTMDYVNRALTLIGPFWKLVTVAIVCLLINSVSSLLIPNSQGRILDRIVAGDRSGFREQVQTFLVLSVLSGLFGAIRNGCFQVVGRKLSVFTRRQLFASLIGQDVEFFDEYSSGELTSRMGNDVGAMTRPITTSLYVVLSSAISLFGGLIMCFVTSWRLSMLAFTTIAPVMFVTGQYAQFNQGLNRSIFAALGAGNAVATQAFSNIRTVKAFGAERKEIGKFDNSMNEALQRGILAALANTLTFSLTNYLDLGASVLLLYFGGISILDDESELTIGKLITFQLYWNMINNAYKSLQNTIAQFTRAAGAAERVFTLMDSLPDIDLDSGEDPGPLTGDISLENVTFYYKSRPERPVISNLSLQIRKGEVLALVGRSGGGKSTLINLLMRFYDPTEGAIFVNGHSQSGGKDLREVNLSKYRKQIGLVAQDTQLFDNTIEDNVVYGLDDGDYDKESLAVACQSANALQFIEDDLEDGYSTHVGERGVKLSGGQRQRIALARLFIKQPRILFLDEATSALDTESEALVQAAIDRTIWETPEDGDADFRASAVVLVAHRLSTVVNADKIAVIDHGTVAEYGNHQELLELGGIYSRLVQRQLQKEANSLDSGTKKLTKMLSVTELMDDLFGDVEKKNKR